MTEFAQDTVNPPVAQSATPGLLRWLPTAFLLAVVGLGAALTVAVPEVRQWPTDQPVTTGQAMVEYEKNNLDPHAPWRDASVGLWASLTYRLFGEARDGALVGDGGWLYTTEEFQTAAGDEAELAATVAYITQVRDDLARTGARLVVALIPAKTRVHPEHLRSRVPRQKDGLYAKVRADLEAAGIPTPDLLGALQRGAAAGQAQFLRTDTHWTPAGARAAAVALRPAVQALELDLPPARYAVKVAAPVERSGDLLRYLPVADAALPDTVREVVYTRVGESGGLLGDEAIAVTLVGTSYSATTPENVWHFGGALAWALGTEVLNAAQAGLGPEVPMREYLSSTDRADQPPSVVIWEIPERFLTLPHKDTP